MRRAAASVRASAPAFRWFFFLAALTASACSASFFLRSDGAFLTRLLHLLDLLRVGLLLLRESSAARSAVFGSIAPGQRLAARRLAAAARRRRRRLPAPRPSGARLPCPCRAFGIGGAGLRDGDVVGARAPDSRRSPERWPESWDGSRSICGAAGFRGLASYPDVPLNGPQTWLIKLRLVRFSSSYFMRA